MTLYIVFEMRAMYFWYDIIFDFNDGAEYRIKSTRYEFLNHILSLSYTHIYTRTNFESELQIKSRLIITKIL